MSKYIIKLYPHFLSYQINGLNEDKKWIAKYLPYLRKRIIG